MFGLGTQIYNIVNQMPVITENLSFRRKHLLTAASYTKVFVPSKQDIEKQEMVQSHVYQLHVPGLLLARHFI